MQLAYIIALVIAVPVLLLEMVFVWCMNCVNHDTAKRIRVVRLPLERTNRTTAKIEITRNNKAGCKYERT